jgi:hypothetical protein
VKLNLPASVASAQDLGALLIETRAYSRWFAHESIKQRIKGGALAKAPIQSAALQELIKSWAGGGTLTQTKLDALIAALENYRKHAPTITVTLAAPATGAIKMTLVTWCRANINPDVLVSFEFNATILGGMVVRSGSHVFDWSFRRQLLGNRQAFPEVLRRV